MKHGQSTVLLRRSAILLISFLAFASKVYSADPIEGQSKTAESSNSAAPKSASPKRPLIQGRVTTSVVIDALQMTGIKCAVRDGKDLVVTNVHMGTSAYYAGITDGDTIRKITKTPDGLQITAERNNKLYQAYIRSEAAVHALSGAANEFNLLATQQTPDQSQLSRKSPLLSAHTSQTNLTGQAKRVEMSADDRRLTSYNIEFIIDISRSMGHIDGTGDLSKFEWCRDQVSSLASRLAPYAQTFTITVFNDRYQTAESCNLAAISEIYSHVRPNGSTDLLDPLMDRCEKVLANYRPGNSATKPTLIAVITDGLPNHPRDPYLVNQALISYTKRLSSAKQVLITFLQIGDTFDGQAFCLDLDQNLVKEGALYDIVDTRPFSELKTEGLTQALLHAIEKTETSR
jgi:hypothetical protein